VDELPHGEVPADAGNVELAVVEDSDDGVELITDDDQLFSKHKPTEEEAFERYKAAGLQKIPVDSQGKITHEWFRSLFHWMAEDSRKYRKQQVLSMDSKLIELLNKLDSLEANANDSLDEDEVRDCFKKFVRKCICKMPGELMGYAMNMLEQNNDSTCELVLANMPEMISEPVANQMALTIFGMTSSSSPTFV